MEPSISNRISQLISHLGMNVTSFSKAIGLTNNVTIGRIIKENRNPSYEVIEKVLQTYGSIINTDWLLTGNADMLKTTESNKKSDEKDIINEKIKSINEKVAYLEGFIKMQNEMIENYKILIERYKNHPENKET